MLLSNHSKYRTTIDYFIVNIAHFNDNYLLPVSEKNYIYIVNIIYTTIDSKF